MARIVGVDIPDNKRLEISLTYIKGIGRAISLEIINKLGLDPNKRAKDLTFDEVAKLNTLLQKEYLIEGNLQREVQKNIERLKSIKSFRGSRHSVNLPVRGQRTRSNARTKRPKKKTVAGKKMAAK
jgi:small subunit ribosomal protein S13